MIHLADGEAAPDRRALDAPGGFTWWYVDLLTPEGDGLVLIWSFGLPFLPGYADAARRGVAPPARARPSLNLATYREGRADFYLLQELSPEAARWEPDGELCRFGDSVLRTAHVDGERALEVELDCPLPCGAGRLEGTLRARGPAVTPTGPLSGFDDADDTHAWSPLLATTEGEASLTLGDQRMNLRGRIYHDRNGSRRPLHALGIAHWLWGRCPFEDRERIYYIVWPEGGGPPKAAGLEVLRDGRLVEVPALGVSLGPARRALFGMRWWRSLELRSAGQPWLEVEVRQRVDNGPFYLRYLTRCRGADGEEVIGLGEAVRPDRVDLDLHRPFVNMAVHHVDGPDSLLLPLFSGPRAGRVGRYLGGLLGGT